MKHEENLAAIGHPKKNMLGYSLYSDWLASSITLMIMASLFWELEHMFSTSSFPLVVM